MKRAISIMLALGMLFCFGCAAQNEDNAPTALNNVENVRTLSFDKWYEQRENMPVEDSFYSAMTSFAAKSAAKVLAGADGNANYSPFSLYYALAMAVEGANGTTRDELLSLLGFGDAETLAEQCGNMYRNMASREREGDADFSGISDMAASIGAVKQETYIAIDENGVEASAYTELDYTGTAMPMDSAELILDRPFIFAITNGSVPLFIGVVNDPSAN